MRQGFFPPLIFISCTGFGCSEWPRYKHTTPVNQNAIDAGALPTDGVSVTWAEPMEEMEPNDVPLEAIEIHKGEGWPIHGVLSGTGWDANATTEMDSECGDTRAFPPSSPGNYTADVDWITLKPAENGILCMDLTTLYDGARLDTALYVLDECGEPIQVFVHADTAAPIGLDGPSSHTRWAIPVDDSASLGIGIAGFWPDDPALEIEWEMELALVPSALGAGDQLCPGAT